MPEHVFTFVARGHAVDAQTNQLTAFSIVEVVGGPALPFTAPELTIVTLWRRGTGEEGAEFLQRVRILRPDGVEHASFDAQFRFDKPRMRMMGQLHGFRFEREGCYRLEVCIRPADDENAWSAPFVSYPIEVQLTDPPSSEPLLTGDG